MLSSQNIWTLLHVHYSSSWTSHCIFKHLNFVQLLWDPVTCPLGKKLGNINSVLHVRCIFNNLNLVQKWDPLGPFHLAFVLTCWKHVHYLPSCKVYIPSTINIWKLAKILFWVKFRTKWVFWHHCAYRTTFISSAEFSSVESDSENAFFSQNKRDIHRGKGDPAYLPDWIHTLFPLRY